MKAHESYLERRLTPEMKEEMEKYNYLLGKTIQAVALEEFFECELFEVVGFTTKVNYTEIFAVLKSKESDVVITVKASDIGRAADSFFIRPSYELKIL